MNKIIHTIEEQEMQEFNKLERAYYEYCSLQTLLSSIIIKNLNQNYNMSDYDFYVEKYIDKFIIFDKQKEEFQEKILKPIYINNFSWIANFIDQEIIVTKYE